MEMVLRLEVMAGIEMSTQIVPITISVEMKIVTIKKLVKRNGEKTLLRRMLH